MIHNCSFSPEVNSWRYRVHGYLFYSSSNPVDVEQSSSKKVDPIGFFKSRQNIGIGICTCENVLVDIGVLCRYICLNSSLSEKTPWQVPASLSHILIGWIEFTHLLRIDCSRSCKIKPATLEPHALDASGVKSVLSVLPVVQHEEVLEFCCCCTDIMNLSFSNDRQGCSDCISWQRNVEHFLQQPWWLLYLIRKFFLFSCRSFLVELFQIMRYG